MKSLTCLLISLMLVSVGFCEEELEFDFESTASTITIDDKEILLGNDANLVCEAERIEDFVCYVCDKHEERYAMTLYPNYAVGDKEICSDCYDNMWVYILEEYKKQYDKKTS